MKNLIISVLILSALTVVFSVNASTVDYEKPYGNWAYFGGNSGDPVPGEGEDGEANTFSILQAETQPQDTTVAEETDRGEVFSISVAHAETPAAEYVLLGVAVTLIVEEIAAVITLCVLLMKNRKRKFHQNRKQY